LPVSSSGIDDVGPSIEIPMMSSFSVWPGCVAVAVPATARLSGTVETWLAGTVNVGLISLT